MVMVFAKLGHLLLIYVVVVVAFFFIDKSGWYSVFSYSIPYYYYISGAARRPLSHHTQFWFNLLNRPSDFL